MNRCLLASGLAACALSGCGGGGTGAPAPVLKSELTVVDDAAVTIGDFRDNFTIANAGGDVSVTSVFDPSDVRRFHRPALIKFADRWVDFDVDGPAGQVYRLYQAAFSRKPDMPGLGFWIKANQDGRAVLDIAADLIGSDEFRSIYGTSVSNRSFVGNLYQNVLHRAGEASGLDWWTAQLDGSLERRAALASFAESSENKINTLPGMANGIDYTPFGLAGSAAPKQVSTCTPDQYLDLATVGEYAVVNNMWNAAPVPGASQCVDYTAYANVGVGSATFRWKYATDAFDVHGYPEILFGHRQGAPSSTTPSLPKPVAQIGSATVTAFANTACDAGVPCHFDTAFDLWFQAANTPQQFMPSLELMVITETNWMNDPQIYRDPVVGTVTIDGVVYDLHYKSMTVAGVGTWPYLAYVARTALNKLDVQLVAFMKDAQARGYLKATDYMTTIEFGTEVVHGSGVTSIRNYEVSIK